MIDRTRLESALERSVADLHLSKTERRDLRELIGAEALSSEERAFVRNRVFDVARAAAGTDPSSFDALLKWAQGVIKSVEANSGDENRAEVFVAPGPDCMQAIQRMLRNSRTSVDICVFTITDDRITSEILACAKRGVNVRIISDDDKSLDRGSDIERLEKAGLKVRTDRSEHHMHHKFAIFDNEFALTGSYNWTRSAAKVNRENILICNDARVVGALAKEFSSLWAEFA